METGSVKFFRDDKGWGFIHGDDGGDVFVHHRAIRMSGFRTLKEGQRVEFNLVEGPRGPQAEEVTVIE